MAVRIDCTADGFEDTWVEVSDRWTRREFKALLESEGDEWLDIFHKKVTGCHIQTSGDPLTSPAAITEDSLDDVDMEIVGFLSTVLLEAVSHLRSLGFMSGRVSLNSDAKKTATM